MLFIDIADKQQISRQIFISIKKLSLKVQI